MANTKPTGWLSDQACCCAKQLQQGCVKLTVGALCSVAAPVARVGSVSGCTAGPHRTRVQEVASMSLATSAGCLHPPNSA